MDGNPCAEEDLQVFQYPLLNQRTDEVTEKCYTCTEDGAVKANGEFREFFFRDLYVNYTNVCLPQKKLLELRECQDLVQLHFSIRCHCSYTATDNAKPFALFEPNQHNLLHFADQPVQMELQPDARLELVKINISHEFLLRYLPHRPVFEKLKEQLIAGKPASLCKDNLPITPRIMTVLYELLNCSNTGYYKYMFVKAKVVELLMLQLEQCEQHVALPAPHKLKAADIEKMHHARDILLQNLESPFSLVELAHLVGTNEYYLKKHFKEVFGTTVFGYLNNYRMEQAKQMLLQGDKKVGDIASALGYKYAAHFTSAFKKHFGYLPQQIKR